ncbi:MAG: carbohydrate ABC transporter substrate-binding protein, partial [Lachnospiraceae bacterium]|nr:carbohydrate ABC transporter substrate-binding protein [Lachnospiraceae bacterium]
IKFLFSKEVQEKPLEDGLPVLVSALDSLKGEVDSEYARSVVMTSIWSVEGEGDIEVQAGYPTVEETAELIDKCRTLSRPVIQDCFIWDCYQTEADACLEGNTDAETAARNVAGKADTYLAE